MTEMVTKEEWVAALRSGEYKQTSEVLCRIGPNGEESFCCLGVYMDLLEKRELASGQEDYNRDTGDQNDLVKTYVFGNPALAEQTVLPSDVLKVSFFNSTNPDIIGSDDTILDGKSLAELNDGGRSFLEIADIIENNYLSGEEV